MDSKPIETDWSKLSKETQDLYVTVLWEDGYSERAIAVFLGTTKGRIVRRRNDLKLPNEGRPALRKVRQVVNPKRFPDLLELHAMRKAEEEKK